MHTVPLEANCIPHVPLVHVGVAQTVTAPGQFDVVTHWTHTPAPLQTVPPPLEHVVPVAEFTQEGTPFVHVAVVHVPHVGRFVASAANPQTPAVHVAV